MEKLKQVFDFSFRPLRNLYDLIINIALGLVVPSMVSAVLAFWYKRFLVFVLLKNIVKFLYPMLLFVMAIYALAGIVLSILNYLKKL